MQRQQFLEVASQYLDAPTIEEKWYGIVATSSNESLSFMTKTGDYQYSCKGMFTGWGATPLKAIADAIKETRRGKTVIDLVDCFGEPSPYNSLTEADCM